MTRKLQCCSHMPAIVLALLISACTVVPGQPGGRYAYVVRSAYPPPLAQFQAAPPAPPPLLIQRPPAVAQPAIPSESGATPNRIITAAVAFKCIFVAHIARDNAELHDRLYNACIQKEADKLKAVMEIGRRIQTQAVEQEYGVKLH